MAPVAPLQFEIARDDILELDLPNGEVTVVGEAIGFAEAKMFISCPSDSQACRKQAAKANINSRHERGRTILSVASATGSGAQVRMTVRVPRDRPVSIKMKYGELSVTDMQSDVFARLKAGEVNIGVPSSAVGRVKLAARFGDASLSLLPATRPIGDPRSRVIRIGANTYSVAAAYSLS